MVVILLIHYNKKTIKLKCKIIESRVFKVLRLMRSGGMATD